METNYNEYYRKQLRISQEYQDFICKELHGCGIVLQNMTSQKSQMKEENLLGLEIKFDDRYEQTGQLYIETAEKAHPDNSEYIPSGIYRQDNSWLFGIGNYSVFFIFGKKTLQRLDKENRSCLYRPAPTPTSKGFCIPKHYAEMYSERIFRFR